MKGHAGSVMSGLCPMKSPHVGAGGGEGELRECVCGEGWPLGLGLSVLLSLSLGVRVSCSLQMVAVDKYSPPLMTRHDKSLAKTEAS